MLVNRFLSTVPRIHKNVCSISSQLKDFKPHRCLTSKSSPPSGISLSYHNNVAVITMNGKENRLNNDAYDQIESHLDSVENNLSCKALVTTGVGKFFSNGLDQDWMGTLTAEGVADFLGRMMTVHRRIMLFPVPTFAVCNGHTFAGGALFALAHDVRTMNSEKGWMCLNEVHIDKRFGEFKIAFLKAKVGTGKSLSDTLILGRRFTADEAYRNRLIHGRFPGETLLEHSLDLVDTFIGKDGLHRESLVNMKKDVYSDVLEAFEKDILDRHAVFRKQFMTPEQLASFESSQE